MKITTITILFFIVSISNIWVILSKLRRETIGIRSGLIWIILWLGIGIFSIFPELLRPLMKLAQMQDKMFFAILTAIFALFALLFNLHSKLDKTQRDVYKVVQELSLMNYRINSMKNSKKDVEE